MPLYGLENMLNMLNNDREIIIARTCFIPFDC